MAELLTQGRIRESAVGQPIALVVLPDETLITDFSIVTAVVLRVFADTDVDGAPGVVWTVTYSVQSDGTLLVSHTTATGEIPARPGAELFLFPEMTAAGFTAPLRTPLPFVLTVDANNQA
jgi:hypothetical protein